MIVTLVSDKLISPVIFSTYHYRAETINNIAKTYNAKIFVIGNTGKIAGEIILC